MGSNMAECHPVGFQWVVEAKERGAKVIHIDPRFTRTSAIADLHVPLRAGSDIVFLGGVINYILENGREFREYVEQYTNARAIIDDGFQDTEDLDGLFSGWDPEKRAYENDTWAYAGTEAKGTSVSGEQVHGAHGGNIEHGRLPREDPTLQDPNCVFQILKRHFRRYTPDVVEQMCGVPRETFLRVAETLCENSGRERTSAFAYAVGWTQHTVGVQYIRAAAIIQLLLGNQGRPGGGILALRGHANIQGSTDIPTLFNILPSYIPMPDAQESGSREEFIEAKGPRTGAWGSLCAYLTSMLKAWWGDAATAENDYCFDYLPRIDGDHSHYATMMKMLDDAVKGFFVVGENPAVGSANGRLQRFAMSHLDWLVVRDTNMVETATFWLDSPEIETGELKPEEIGTEVFFLPAAAHTEKEGTFTNTQRLLQWRHKAVEPPEECRSDLHFFYHLGRRLRAKIAGSSENRDGALLDLTWDYPTAGPHEEPDADAVLQEINGKNLETGEFIKVYDELKEDGTTSSGSWLHTGIYADGVNQSARRKPGQDQNWVASEWGWAWPKNQRIMYNRASADSDGKPWSERKKYIWWDESEGKWTGYDVPDFPADKPPSYVPPDDAKGIAALTGREPFIVHPDGLGWLFAPSGVIDGPLPAHYEPQESPFENLLYGQQHNPARQVYDRPETPYNPERSDVFPFVVTSYRLTEHHTAGGMSRTVKYLSELQPELFCEVSPELAAERGLEHRGWATIVTTRTAIEARVLVTDRVMPIEVQGQRLEQVGLPYHWGVRGLVTGDSVNDLFGLALDPNVHIQEVKAATCDVVAGRRPRGPALLAFVEEYRERATGHRPQATGT
jgi:formate dehydrogenase major subunit